jgi:hypothetical protein
MVIGAGEVGDDTVHLGVDPPGAESSLLGPGHEERQALVVDENHPLHQCSLGARTSRVGANDVAPEPRCAVPNRLMRFVFRSIEGHWAEMTADTALMVRSGFSDRLSAGFFARFTTIRGDGGMRQRVIVGAGNSTAVVPRGRPFPSTVWCSRRGCRSTSRSGSSRANGDKSLSRTIAELSIERSRSLAAVGRSIDL